MSFQLHSPFEPCGDQPQAITKLVSGFQGGHDQHTLMGVTGSGKTFTMAHVIAKLGVPTLIMAPNKTLAGQLFSEFLEFFGPECVDFFISYYDYYQPEAYIPSTDTYIAKDSSINDDIDKMRHRCTQNLFEKSQLIIIASVSCIYGLGSPNHYSELAIPLHVGLEISRDELLEKLIHIRYHRSDAVLKRGSFRVRGDVCDIMPAHQKDQAIRIELFGDEIEEISLIQSSTGDLIGPMDKVTLYPNSHYVTNSRSVSSIVTQIDKDLHQQIKVLESMGKMVEATRLKQRTLQDMETIEAFGSCPGIENYSRYLSGHTPGQPPPTLLDYFPQKFLTIIDESHLTIPQIIGMYRGDRARKQNLVDFGFRLPSALDNRPLRFDEFCHRTDQVLYVSATPGNYEKEQTKNHFVQQIIRPTGLVDPDIIVKPAKTQMDELASELTQLKEHGGKAFVLTLTKKMAEDLSTYFADMGFRIRYLHSKIKTLERAEILKQLREDEFDILVGINLLREGLDLPEVSLVAILDADKEGFLRSKNSLIQMIGRAARNVNGRVVFFADSMTHSMQAAIHETKRRRTIQLNYNKTHNITPRSVHKKIAPHFKSIYGLDHSEEDLMNSNHEESPQLSADQIKNLTQSIAQKTAQMKKAAADLHFEKALILKKQITQLRQHMNPET